MNDQTEKKAYIHDPLYQAVLSHYQEGEWDQGVKKIEELLDKYPNNDDLLEFKNEFHIRLAISEEEIQDDINQKKKKQRRKILRYLSIILVVIGLLYGLFSLAMWVQEHNAEIAMARVQNARQISVDKKLSNAQSLLQAGKPKEALMVINEIRELSPENSQIDPLLLEAQAQIELEEKYSEAVEQIANQNYKTALELLLEIDKQNPTYKDVEYKIRILENYLFVIENVASGDASYADEQWGEAIETYEAALDNFPNTDIGIDKNRVRDNLYQCYVNQILKILAKEEIGDEDIAIAVDNYKNFLAMRPQDKDSLEQREAIKASFTNVIIQNYISTANQHLLNNENMERSIQLADEIVNKAIALQTPDENVVNFSENLSLYKSAISSIKENDWDAATDALHTIDENDPQFAGDVVKMLIFEAYMELGNNSLLRGFYQDALGYYELALSAADQMKQEMLLPSLQARMDIALVLGKLGAYEDAVNLYRAIIDDFNLSQRINTRGDADLQNRLAAANSNFFKGDFRSAYLDYVGAFERIQLIYEYNQTSIQEGDNLAGIAINYQSTVQAIIAENEMSHQIIATENRDINIPTFPSKGQ
jgi:tetratricopeptide (TPR) repeat protein